MLEQLRWGGALEPADPRVLPAGMIEGRLHTKSSALQATFLQCSTLGDEVRLSSVQLLQKDERKSLFFDSC